jgi:hypothetical protein
MTDEPTNLDQRRSRVAQDATDARRRTLEIKADQAKLTERKLELERHLFASPSATWREAAEKARYLLGLLALTPAAEDARVRTMIAAVLSDFDRLAAPPRPEGRPDPE